MYEHFVTFTFSEEVDEENLRYDGQDLEVLNQMIDSIEAGCRTDFTMPFN